MERFLSVSWAKTENPNNIFEILSQTIKVYPV